MNDVIKTVKPRSVKKTSPEQFELLRSEMTTHTAAALGYGSGRDRAIVDAEWKEIMEKLNAIGPPYRTLPEWKKVWSDVRLRSKKIMCEEFQRKCKSESDDDILMETLNSASTFYNSHNSSDQDYSNTMVAQNENENGVEGQHLPDGKLNHEYSGKTETNHAKHRGMEYHHQYGAMQRNNRKKKTTPEQFQLLKQEMAKHPLAAKGYGTGKDRCKVDAEWREILEKLNKLGPPYRNMTEWKKVWSDVRLRVRKRMGKPPKPSSKKRRVKKESDSDSDDFMESLKETNSLFKEENNDFCQKQSIHLETPTGTTSENMDQPYVMNEQNPLDDDNNDVNDHNDETTSYHRDYQISELEEGSHFNDTTDMPQHSTNQHFMEHTLNALQMQSEQHDKILQHLTKISESMVTVIQNQVSALERRNELMEAQIRTNDFNSYMQRRHELRRKGRCKIIEWF